VQCCSCGRPAQEHQTKTKGPTTAKSTSDLCTKNIGVAHSQFAIKFDGAQLERTLSIAPNRQRLIAVDSHVPLIQVETCRQSLAPEPSEAFAPDDSAPGLGASTAWDRAKSRHYYIVALAGPSIAPWSADSSVGTKAKDEFIATRQNGLECFSFDGKELMPIFAPIGLIGDETF
jgi:hypothetical protein